MTNCEQNIIGDNMSLVIIRAFIIYVFVIVAVRIMGKRQVGELKPHELVITFLIVPRPQFRFRITICRF